MRNKPGGESRSPFRMAHWMTQGMGLLCWLWLIPVMVAADDKLTPTSPSDPRELSAEEKIELRAKRERFVSLPIDEQRRIRSLHEQISQQEDQDRLVRVMRRYDEWLRTLTHIRRAELVELPPEKRLERIRQLKHEATCTRFEGFTHGRISPKDLDVLYRWLDDFLVQHEKELEKQVPHELRPFMLKLEEGPQKRLWLLGPPARFRRGPPAWPIPSESEIAKLQGMLSEEVRSEIESLSSLEEKKQFVFGLIHAVVNSRRPEPPPVNTEELEKFFRDELAKGRQDELLLLPKDRMQRELRWEYFKETLRRQNGGNMPRFFGRPPFGPGRGGRGRDGDRERDRSGDRGRDGDGDRDFEKDRRRPGPPDVQEMDRNRDRPPPP